jgi:biotin transporter BioY
MTFSKAALAVVVFLPGDTIKAVIASIVAQRIRRLNLV